MTLDYLMISIDFAPRARFIFLLRWFFMNTKTVCSKFNVSPKALRIYERLGILVPERAKNNYREYNENDMMKLRQLVLLKELGIPLVNIKKILDKEFDENNEIIRGLDIQLKAVENKISELENIKSTLKQSINEELSDKTNNSHNDYFIEITKCLNENRENRIIWMDKWGFDSWAENYDN
jgi:putative AdoMet-dependent methyltransferase